MANFFTRQSAAYRNDLNRSAGALIGIAQGFLGDGHLNDDEVHFLHSWLNQNQSIATTWPGDAIFARVKDILADGQITTEERAHLTEMLQQLIGGSAEELAEPTHVTELALDRTAAVTIPERTFCLTGDFVFATRAHCESVIQKRGGFTSKSVTKKVQYVVVGGLGSAEWKHGSFGTKIEKAIEYKRQGVPLLIVHEDQWAPAWHLARAPLWSIIRRAGQAPFRLRPLSSNVRPHGRGAKEANAMAVKLEDARKCALALPDTTEEPHHNFGSFRVRGKIFVTIPPGGELLHIFLPEQQRELALAMDPEFLEPVLWGNKVLGVRAKLPLARKATVLELIKQAYAFKAEKVATRSSSKPSTRPARRAKSAA